MIGVQPTLCDMDAAFKAKTWQAAHQEQQRHDDCFAWNDQSRERHGQHDLTLPLHARKRAYATRLLTSSASAIVITETKSEFSRKRKNLLFSNTDV